SQDAQIARTTSRMPTKPSPLKDDSILNTFGFYMHNKPPNEPSTALETRSSFVSLRSKRLLLNRVLLY
ncbi:hypothetical protein Ancab_004984, partial [Ancistrocladus abbreviatus]